MEVAALCRLPDNCSVALASFRGVNCCLTNLNKAKAYGGFSISEALRFCMAK